MVKPDAAAQPAARLPWLRQERFTLLAPLAAVVLFLAVVVAAFLFLRMEEARREQEAVKRDVEYGQQRLRQRLQERQEQLMRLARDMASYPIDAKQFGMRAEYLIAQYPELLALSWIDAQHRVAALQASPSVSAERGWMDGGAPRINQTEASYALARAHLQPVYAPPVAGENADWILRLHVPIAQNSQFAGELLAEYSVDALLRYGVPPEVLSRYAIALLDGDGQLLTGQSIPERPGFLGWRAWTEKVNKFEVPVMPAGGSGLILRAQAWRTSQGVVGSTLFWLAAVLAAMTTWMLLANWRQSQRRQQAQQALQAEMSFRRAMENSMLTGMRALDLQGRITYVNAAFCQMTGWSEGELVGQSEPFPYWPEEDRQVLSARLADELRGRVDPAGFQMRVKRKNGTLFDARLYISPLIDAIGKHSGWMASMTDITEPNRVRRELSAAHERFTTVLEALDASVSVAPLGSQELLFANKLYRQWFGGVSSGHMTLVVRAGTPPARGQQESGDAVDSFAGLPLELDSLQAPASEHAEIYVEQLDKWLEVRSRYLNWVDGRLAQMVIATDISARRRAQEQAAAQAERAQTASRLIAMGEMASSVAHEINQPLTAISNYCTGIISRLRGGAIGQDELLTALDKTARQAQRAGQVVQHIRSFVKRSQPRRQLTQAQAIAEQALELADIELRRRGVRLTRHIEPGLPTLHADPILIEQALLNLIKNGAESIEAAARPPGERVVDLRVTRHQADGAPAVRFAVTDSGRGLAPQVVDRLYEAFFTTKSEGLGVGLNLCRSIVEAHRGRIEAGNLYNAGQIVGCCFSFWIPARPAASARNPPDSSEKVVA